MNSGEITIKGVPMEAKKKKDGDIYLVFKIETYDNKHSLYKVIVKQEYWKNAVLDMKDINYFVIKGTLKACVNSKGMPFISVEASSIKIFNLPKNEAGDIDLSTDMPKGTEEMVDIHSIINENPELSVNRAKKKAMNYIRENKKFHQPLVVEKESMILLSGQEQYAAALELGIHSVPVTYGER